jgi:uncharacterized repeat protein (TIGR03803 family)
MSKCRPYWLFASAASLAAASALPASAATETIIYSFTDAATGDSPLGKLLIDGSGNLYGSTLGLGYHSGYEYTGNLDYTLAPPASPGGSWTQTVLYSFPNHKHGYAIGGMAADPHGNIYEINEFNASPAAGACYTSGHLNIGCGLIEELKRPTGTGTTWALKKAFGFTDTTATRANGLLPEVGLIADAAGALYGATSQGGAGTGGGYGGVVFKLTPPAHGQPWSEAVLYNFCSQASCTDGDLPLAGPPLLGPNGVLYGVTTSGGSTSCNTQYQGCGVVFMLTPPTGGGGWTYSNLYDFAGGTTDGAEPYGGLAMDASGALYGTTYYGGNSTCTQQAANGCGVVFKLSPPGGAGGAWTESVIYNFTNGSDGGGPTYGLVSDSSGALYGTTQLGAGSVFKLAPPASPGGAWTQSTLHSFNAYSGDGQIPSGGVLLGNDGSTLYGVTSDGGVNGAGAVYEISQ